MRQVLFDAKWLHRAARGHLERCRRHNGHRLYSDGVRNFSHHYQVLFEGVIMMETGWTKYQGDNQIVTYHLNNEPA